jgi:hypothetical protein
LIAALADRGEHLLGARGGDVGAIIFGSTETPQAKLAKRAAEGTKTKRKGLADADPRRRWNAARSGRGAPCRVGNRWG